MRKTTNLMLLVFLAVSLFTVEIVAQCVQCQSSGSGGRECQSNGFAESSVDSKGLGIVKVDEAILREIAEKHPRFAIALSLAAESGFIGEDDVKVLVVPVEFTKADFEKWLEFKKVEQSGKPFKNFGGFAQKLNEFDENTPPVTYVIKTETITGDQATIKLNVEQAFYLDPAFSSLEVGLRRAKGNASEKATWIVESWRLR